MPVTAKLSKRFYDVLGEDVANELVDWFNAVDLTYRADLRELNELNFARFDAKLEQRLAELRAELGTELHTELARMRSELAELRADLRTELHTELGKMRSELVGLRAALQDGTTALERVRVELLRWMFGFWVTTFIGLAGLMIALR
jgi:hypothetical protein